MKTPLINGFLPANTACPMDSCVCARAGRHQGEDHRTRFSCALLRAYALTQEGQSRIEEQTSNAPEYQLGNPSVIRCPSCGAKNNGCLVEDGERRYCDLSCDYDESLWLDFGDVSRGILQSQNQYASRYVDGRLGSVNCGEGLRFRRRGGGPVDTSDYHFIEIHRDDVEEFVRRVQKARGH